jgi:drug/metabolite transporter (DMT)-like permease
VKQKTTGYGFLLLTILLFSTYEVVGRTFAAEIPPLFVSGVRFVLGGLILLPFALKDMRRRDLTLKAQDVAILTALGLLNAGVAMGLLQMSLQFINASTSAVLFSSNPLLVMAFSTIMLKEPITKGKVLSLALGIAGMVFVAGGFVVHSLTGVLLALGATAAFGFYTVAGKQLTNRYGTLVMNGVSFVLGGGIVLLASVALPGEGLVISARNWLLLVYLGVFVTGIAYYAFFTGLSYTDTTLGSAVFFCKPVFACLFAYYLLGEAITPGQVVGIGLILAAMLLIFIPVQRGASSPSHAQKRI